MIPQKQQNVAPPHLPEACNERTWVFVRLDPHPEGVLVGIDHLGWRDGAQWDETYAYFDHAWDVVLDRLRRRFVEGPLEWDAVQRRLSDQ